MAKIKFIFCALVLSYLSSCTNELIAGSTYSPDDKNIYVDAIGTQARFGTIVAIGVDSQDNVYVADIGNGRIRKIAPNRQVSTLAGTNQVQAQFPDRADPLNTQLVDLGGLTVYDDTLYFTVKGCIRSIDLKQPESERKINTFYGKCLSEQEKEKSTQDYLDEGLKPEYLSALENLKLSAFGMLKHDPNGNLYVVAESIYSYPNSNKYEDTGYIHTLNLNKKIIHRIVAPVAFGNYFEVDKEQCLYYPTQSPYSGIMNYSWCDHSQDSRLFVDSHENELESPYALLIGRSNAIYIFSNWLAIKRPGSQFKLVSDIPRLEGRVFVLNPSETVLYSASYRQVYKLNLPK